MVGILSQGVFVNRLLSISRRTRVVLFVVLDVVSIGMGMGVPFFTILLGIPVGWFTARRQRLPLPEAMRKCFRVALSTSAVSLVFLGIIWLPWAPTAWAPEAELLQTGIPMILFDPRASFVGWIALMVVVSPTLQVLTTLSASYVVLMRQFRGGP